jgi:hypothetical protein
VDALLARLAAWLSRRARAVALVWLAIIAGGAWFSLHQTDHLQGGGWQVPGSQAVRANDLLTRFNGFSVSGLAVAVTAPESDVTIGRARVDQQRYLASLCCAPPKSLTEAFGIPPAALLRKIYNEVADPGFLARELASAQPPGPSNKVFASGKTLSNLCADVIPFQDAQANALLADLPAEWQRLGRNDDNVEPINRYGCQVWNVKRSNVSQRDPVVSSIPTIVFVDEWDHIIWPGEGHQIAKSLRNARLYEIPGLDHLALLNFGALDVSCPRSIVSAFLAAPNKAPDGRCVRSMRNAPLVPRRGA